MSELSGAVVFVVGASGDLGSRLSEQLAEAGATVIRGSRSPQPGGVAIDLRDPASIASALAEVVLRHGRLDGVVIAAGVVAFGAADAVRNDTLQELFEVNATGPMQLIRDATPLLAASAQHGHAPFIVTLSGVVAESPTAGIAAYSAAKSALSAFTKAAARELRRSGIRIIDARPGHTETGLSQRAIQGTPPAFGVGLSPDAVAERIVRAIRDDEKDLPSSEFA